MMNAETKKQVDRKDFFFLKSNEGVTTLRKWLMERQYNAYRAGRADKKGNPMIGLSMEKKRGWERRGIIVSATPGLNELALNSVVEFCSSVKE